MAITSLALVRAGLQPPQFFSKILTITGSQQAGLLYSSWAQTGAPVAGSFSSSLNGVTLSNPTTGQIPWNDPPTGNAYLSRFQGGIGNQAAALILADRLWHNGGFTITSTSAQAITSPTWPARDNNGATSGDGVLLGVEVSATVGAATSTITVSYTNSSGTAGQSGTNTITAPSGARAQTFIPIGLAAGDTGVQAVASLTLGTSLLSGTINLVAYRPIAIICPPYANEPVAIDAITAGMPRMYAGSVPFLLWQASTTTFPSNLVGEVGYAFG